MKIAFLGHECAAAGFRLAGATASTPGEGAEVAALQAAMREARLVLVAADVAARLPAAMLRDAVAKASPPVVVVPDVAGGVAWPDPAADLGRQLGLDVR